MIHIKDLLKENVNRFKDLKKSKKDEKLEELRGVISSGDWILKEPLLYRGRGWDGIFKVKDSTNYERRETRDTKQYYDYLIHDFTVNCNSEYPDRWQSRFALTKRGDADIFGSETYVILPEKSSKLAYSEIDSYDILVDEPKLKSAFSDGLQKFYQKIEQENITAAYYNLRKKMSSEVQDLISDLLKVYKGEEVSITNYGCSDEILRTLDDEMEKFDGDEPSQIKVFKGLSKLAWIFRYVIQEYFSLYTLAYPPSKNKGAGEVMYQGRYLQVHVELFDYLKEKYKN